MDGTSLSIWCGFRKATVFLFLCMTAVVGCSTFLGTTSKSFLRQVRENPDPNVRYVAYAKLGIRDIYETGAQKKEAVDTLIAKFEEGLEPVAVRAVIVRSLGNLGDRRARGVVLKAVNDVDNAVIRVEACRALGKVGSPEDATTLARIMTVDKLEDCRIASIEGIGLLKARDPRIYQILLDGMDHDDPAIRLECLRALRSITGKDVGIDPAAWRRELDPTIREMSGDAASSAASRPVASGSNASPRG
jgi:HEAT repeat protein